MDHGLTVYHGIPSLEDISRLSQLSRLCMSTTTRVMSPSMESCLQLPVTRGALLFFSEFMGINVNPGLIKSEAVELVANFSSRWSHVYAKLPSSSHNLVTCSCPCQVSDRQLPSCNHMWQMEIPYKCENHPQMVEFSASHV